MSVVKRLIISSLSAHNEKQPIKDFDKRIDIKVGNGFEQGEDPPNWNEILDKRQKIKADDNFNILMNKYLGEDCNNERTIETIIKNIMPKKRTINNFFPYRMVEHENDKDFWTLNAVTASFEQMAYYQSKNNHDNKLLDCNYICFASVQAIKNQLPFVLNKCIDYGIISQERKGEVIRLNEGFRVKLQTCEHKDLSKHTLDYINEISARIEAVDVYQISDIDDGDPGTTNAIDNDGEEVKKIFKGVFNKIDAMSNRTKDRVDIKLTLEVTQGFRSSTLLLFLVAKFAVLLYDNVSIEHIYYAKNINETSSDINKYQLIDLQLYDYLLDAAFSMDSFVKFGVARDLNKIKDKDELETNIGKILSSIERFADAIHLSRGIDIKNNVTEFNSSMAAFENLWNVLSTYDNSTVKSISDYLVSRLSKLVKDNIKEFDGKKQIYDFGLNVVAWCLERDLIQQAVTALHTLLNEFLIDKTKESNICGNDVLDNQKLSDLRKHFNISKMDYAFRNYCIVTNKDGKRFMQFDYKKEAQLFPEHYALNKVYNNITPYIKQIVTDLEKKDEYYKFLNNNNIKVKPTLKNLMQNLNNIRNDMNHYGILEGKLVVRTDRVKQQVESYYKVIDKLITKY